jgi:photosystem II stability/assembly factor-like uncharacterized protein
VPTGETARSDKFPAAKAQTQPPSGSQRDSDPDSQQDEQGKQGKEEKDSPDAVRKREEWFYKQRASVNGHIPGGARLKALQHMQRMMAAEGKLVLRADGTYAAATPQAGSTSFPAWSSIGPTPTTGGEFSPVTGRVTTIAVDPSDTTGNTVLIGGAQGGIWRSTDAGMTWAAVGDQNASLAMGSIAFAPSQPATVYAGTGEQASIGFDIYYGAGVLKSTDHGMTWTQTCTVASTTCPFIGPYLDSLNPSFGFFNFGGARISYIAVNPQNPQLVLVAAQLGIEGPTEGIYCSSNGGATWSNIFPDETATFVGFASSTVAFAAFGTPFGSSAGAPHGNGIYKSTNANSCSATFTPVTTGLPPQTSIGRIDMGISPNYASDNTVYASIADATQASNTNLGVWVTNNGGTSWTQTAAPDICQEQCWYDNVLKVDPNNKNTVYFGGSAVEDSNGNPNWVIRTTNGGTSWSSVIPSQLGPGFPHVDTHALAFFKLTSGQVRLYLGNDGGIWRTDDAEATPVQWTNLNGSSLTLTQFYPTISIHTSTPSIAFGGTQDNSSQQFAGAASWVTSTGTFPTSSGSEESEVCGDGTSTAIDPLVPSTVYISCQFSSVNASYETGAAGSFFPAVNGIDLTESAGFVPPLVADPNQESVVYFGAERVYQSVDAANSWTAISPYLGGNGNTLTALAVGAQNSSVIYAGTNNGIVFVATGFTNGAFVGFQNYSPTQSQARGVTAIAVDPSDSTGLTAYASFTGFAYVGTDALNPNVQINDAMGHIFKTVNGGQNWRDVSCSTANCSEPAATDLPNIPVNDVVVDPDLPGVIYAATDLGVYVTTCTAAPCTWSTLSTGLPRVAVLSMRLHHASRTLRAATHGRGAWDLLLSNFAFTGPRIFSLTPTSANSGGAQLTLTVTGTGLTGGTILFGSTALTATGVSSDTSLSGTIPPALLTSGSVKVTVTTGSPAVTSNAVPFSVLALTPTLASSNPPNTPVQTPPSPPIANIPIQVAGTNFAAGARIDFDGVQNGITVAAPTSSCPLPTCLAATLPAGLLGPWGSTNDIEVLNLPPGGGKSQPLTFKVVAPPPPNDNFANAAVISGLFGGGFFDSSGATTESSDPTPPCAHQYPTNLDTGGEPNGVYNTVWYKFTPTFSANVEADTINSNYDTLLSIWTGGPGNFVNVACNDDINPGIDIQSQLTAVPLAAGTTYYFMISSFGPPDRNPLALGGETIFHLTYNNGLNPSPVITSITPTSANSNDPAISLTVNGTGFFNGATVQFFDTLFQTISLTTTFVNSTQVTAVIPSSAIPFPGTAYVSVANPSPSVPSNDLVFTVNPGANPIPTLISISPNSVVAGTIAPVTIEAFGTLIASNAVLNFSGASYPPAPGSVTTTHAQLMFPVPASAFATPGTFQVSISNPTPGGGPSNALPFVIATPNPVPTITSLSPSSGPAGTFATVNVIGTNFLVGAQGCIGTSTGIVCSPVTSFVSSTQVSVGVSLPSNPGAIPFYVVDPAPGGSSNPVQFTVTGPPDFSFTVVAGQGSQTVTAGQTATFTNVVTVNALNGFTGQVAVYCTSPAQATTCSLSHNTLTAGQAATVMVTTTARSLAPPLPLSRRMISWPRVMPVIVLTLLCVLLTRLARTRRQRIAAVLPLAGVILFLVLQAVGCGGGSSQPPPPPPPTGTLAGTYTITVTGTSTNPVATHTATLQLIVN